MKEGEGVWLLSLGICCQRVGATGLFFLDMNIPTFVDGMEGKGSVLNFFLFCYIYCPTYYDQPLVQNSPREAFLPLVSPPLK